MPDPGSKKEAKLWSSLVRQYGERAEEVYMAMLNSGKHDQVFSKHTLAKRARKHKHSQKK